MAIVGWDIVTSAVLTSQLFLGRVIYSRETAEQKLNYIHFNPVSGKWMLSKDDLDYYYSSARFYETGVDDFGLLHNLYDRIDGV